MFEIHVSFAFESWEKFSNYNLSLGLNVVLALPFCSGICFFTLYKIIAINYIWYFAKHKSGKRDIICFKTFFLLLFVMIMLCTKHHRRCIITFPNTKKRFESTMHSKVSTNFQRVWDCKATVSQLFNISPQSTLKLRRKWRNKVISKNLC